MTHECFQFFGTAGSIVLCASALPQVLKTWRTKSADDLSLAYLVMVLCGMIMLQIYSIHVRDVVFIFGNTLSLVMSVTLLALVCKYRKRRDRAALRAEEHPSERPHADER